MTCNHISSEAGSISAPRPPPQKQAVYQRAG
eukprot:CAMPEP_0117674026 /NCGR_PEP_ID=MMETSP0804-20121206/14805_1 /TAXON_ID=1074897 /ORGANISM="Tetraselmis astigmatica, Strain CCMP880" /LENGTH=30 /DNA_ID= /DNA_START= /DNA_END= /DNA_ORIENTATION=